MKKTAVFPGSFDPITRGHEYVLRQAIPLFDEIIIAVGENTEKKHLFSLEQRIQWIKKVFSNEKTVSVSTYTGLTVDFCRSVGARYILRGLRTSADFEFERVIAQMNRQLFPGIETVFLLTASEYSHLSSSIVREIYLCKGDLRDFIPVGVEIR